MTPSSASAGKSGPTSSAYYILEDRADALDAVQDLYMKLWKIRDSLDLVRNPGAYGALLMRNLCIDRIRRLNPTAELSDDLPGQDPPDEELIRKESLGSLLRAMDTLPGSQRKLMRLHVLQGRSYDEIAAETGLSPLNIRVQVQAAVRKPARWALPAGVAAAAVTLLAVGLTLTRNPEPKDTFDDPYLAYAEVEKVFAKISGTVAYGADKVSQSEQTLDKLTYWK